jgi:hypothetical protein
MDRRSFVVFVFVLFQAKGQNSMVKAPNETVNEIGKKLRCSPHIFGLFLS